MSHDAHSSGPGSKRPSIILPPVNHGGHEEGGEGWLVSYADMMTLLVGFFVILMSFSKVDEEKLEEVKKSATKEFGGVYRAPHQELTAAMKNELQKLGLGDQFVLKTTPSGLEISFSGAVFFDSGSADLKEEAVTVVNKLIHVINTEAKGYSVQIEGHTDDIPLNGGRALRNNWELSAIRASRVLELFQNDGFDEKSLTAIGYGDARPIKPNRDAEGNPIPENQAENRRVLVRIIKPIENFSGPSEVQPGQSESASAPPAK